MDGSYRIGADKQRGFYRLSFVGTLDANMLEAAAREMKERRALPNDKPSASPDLSLLVDLRAMNLQTQDVARLIQDHVEADAEMWANIAVVLPQSPLRVMQVKRISRRDNHAFFRDEAEATQWLAGKRA